MKPEILKKALSVASQIGNKMPVLFVIENGSFFVGSTGDAVSVVVEGKTSLPDNTFILPQEHVRQIVKTLKSSLPVDIQALPSGAMSLKQGKSSITYTVTENPSLTVRLLTHWFNNQFSISLNTAEFSRALSKISPFAGGTVVSRKVDGLHFTYDSDKVTMMTTNSFSFAATSIEAKEIDKGMVGTFIFPKSILGIDKALGTSFKMGINNKRLIILGEDDDLAYKITMPTVDESPFPYMLLIDKLVKDATTHKILVDRDDLLDALKSSTYFTDANVRNRIQMDYLSDEIILSSTDDAKGEVKCVVDTVKMEGSGEMLLSADFLQKGVTCFSGEVKLTISPLLKQMMITDSNTFVIVPSMKK